MAILDSSEDVENRVRVIPTASAPIKTIHVARASSKFRSSLTISNNGSISGKALLKPEITRKVVQPRLDTMSKITTTANAAKISTKLPRVVALPNVSLTVPASVVKSRIENEKLTATTLLLKEHALASKAMKFNGQDITNLFFPTTKAITKRIYSRKSAKLAIKQDPILAKEYDLEIYNYWKEMEVLGLFILDNPSS
jgi:hypothetical protein